MTRGRTNNGLAVLILMLFAAVQAVAAQDAAQSASAETPTANKRLDLRIPDITEIFSPEEIAVFIARTQYPETIEQVEVEGRRVPRPPKTPAVWPGIAAPFWAILNPTQAWRIFAPLPPDQVHQLVQLTPDATNPYREPAAFNDWYPY